VLKLFSELSKGLNGNSHKNGSTQPKD